MLPIPCTLMRGGTSKGPYFLLSDLPEKGEARDEALINLMGAGHMLQIDGIGGAQPQSSKVAIVSKSSRSDADVDYLFAQVSVQERRVDWSPNCGNMLSAVAPFALEKGLVPSTPNETVVRIFNVNTTALIHATVQTPCGKVSYEGKTAIDGVPGTAAPITLKFLDATGSKTGALLPTSHPQELIKGVKVTLIDYAMPMMLIKAEDMGLIGDETPEFLENNAALMQRLEAMRLEAGMRMGLGDVSHKVIPKMALLSKARHGGTITSRYFMPVKCHKSHAVTGALCISAALALENTIAHELVKPTDIITIEHPSGKIDVVIERNDDGTLASASLLRTARKLFEGTVYAS
jgi:4-oxalomesaconate tautomerase